MKKKILMINVHEDDVLCFRKEVIFKLAEEYQMVLMYPLGEHTDQLKHENITFEDVKMDRHGHNVIKDFKLLLHYKRVIKKHRPDLVLLYTIKPNIYGAMVATWYHIPFVNNITGIGSSMYGHENLLNKFVSFLYKIALRKTEHIFFQNPENMELFLHKKICKADNTSIIPGSGVALDRFTYEEYPDQSTVVFNFIGRVMKKKGIVEYVEAARRVKEKCDNCQFNVFGFIEEDEPDMKQLIEKADAEGVIKYHGNQSDIKPWIARSHAIILPSKYGEGVSNVLLESAATGRVIFTTDIPGCACLVQNDNGYVFKKGSTDGIVDAVLEFIALPYEKKKQMGKNSRELVEKSYSRQIVVSEYTDIAHRILG